MPTQGVLAIRRFSTASFSTVDRYEYVTVTVRSVPSTATTTPY